MGILKLEIEGKAYAEAEVNLMAFKRDLPLGWDLEKSIRDNTRITLKDHRFSEDNLKTLVWGALDWVGIIEALSGVHKPVMRVKFLVVRYSDWKRLYPGRLQGKEFSFLECNQEGHSTLLIQDLITNKNFDLKSFIKQGCFLYASTEKEAIARWIR